MGSAAIRALKRSGHGIWCRPAALVAAVALAGTLSACTPGVYTFDIFREMHYQESQRLQEPNRLAPPAGAIPFFTGKVPAVPFEQASTLTNPVPANDASREQARKLFMTNCSACHGKNADGKSEVATRFQSAGAVPPPDFRSSRVQSHTDGQLYWLISNGVSNMPPFGDILSDEQRWTIVQYIRNPQQAQ